MKIFEHIPERNLTASTTGTESVQRGASPLHISSFLILLPNLLTPPSAISPFSPRISLKVYVNACNGLPPNKSILTQSFITFDRHQSKRVYENPPKGSYKSNTYNYLLPLNKSNKSFTHES